MLSALAHFPRLLYGLQYAMLLLHHFHHIGSFYMYIISVDFHFVSSDILLKWDNSFNVYQCRLDMKLQNYD